MAYWGGVFFLVLVVHATQDRLGALLVAFADLAGASLLDARRDTLLAYAPSLKGLVFLIALALVSSPIVRDAYELFSFPARQRVLLSAGFSLLTVLVLLSLTFHLGSASMGTGYAIRSLAPFQQMADWYHKRLLMPALAHILFFRGGWLYFAFGLAITVCFLTVLRNWLRDHAPLPFWQFVSLCTCSFVTFQFQFPGYPDILAFGFFVLVMSNGFSQQSKTALLVLALVTHEASLFIGILLAWRFLDKKHFTSYVLALGFYSFAWLAGFSLSFDSLLSSHNVGGMSVAQWVFQNPKAAVLGFFVAFKAVWVLPLLAVLIDIRQRQWERALFVSLGCCISVLMVFLGVDTSRMAGWAFPAILVSLLTIHERLAPRTASRLLTIVFSVNFFIPSLYVGLNTWIVLRRGGYWWMSQFMMSVKRLVEQGF